MEAVIAAMYLDGGLEPVSKFIIENLNDEIAVATQHVGRKRLQNNVTRKIARTWKSKNCV